MGGGFQTPMNVHFSSASDNWPTPDGFADQFGPFDLDPCADHDNHKAPTYFTKDDDELDITVNRTFLQEQARAILQQVNP